MTISKIAVYITLFLCFACESGKEVTPEIILPEPSSLEKILTRGSLEISTFYNTTDYYVYRGITRGFHYDLARDFAVDAVVDLTWQGCQPYDVESWSVKKFVREELGLPFLQVVTDYSGTDTEQLKVRLEAFLEMLA